MTSMGMILGAYRGTLNDHIALWDSTNDAEWVVQSDGVASQDTGYTYLAVTKQHPSQPLVYISHFSYQSPLRTNTFARYRRRKSQLLTRLRSSFCVSHQAPLSAFSYSQPRPWQSTDQEPHYAIPNSRRHRWRVSASTSPPTLRMRSELGSVCVEPL